MTLLDFVGYKTEEDVSSVSFFREERDEFLAISDALERANARVSMAFRNLAQDKETAPIAKGYRDSLRRMYKECVTAAALLGDAHVALRIEPRKNK